MADWTIWLMFAAKVLEILMDLFGDDSPIVAKYQDRIIDKIVDRMDTPDVPPEKELTKKSA